MLLTEVITNAFNVLSDQLSEAEREALDDQQQASQHQGLNLKGKKSEKESISLV